MPQDASKAPEKCGVCELELAPGAPRIKLPGGREIPLCQPHHRDSERILAGGLSALVELGVAPARIQQGYAVAKAGGQIVQGLRELAAAFAPPSNS